MLLFDTFKPYLMVRYVGNVPGTYWKICGAIGGATTSPQSVTTSTWSFFIQHVPMTVTLWSWAYNISVMTWHASTVTVWQSHKTKVLQSHPKNLLDLVLISDRVGSAMRALTDGQTDGRCKVHYLAALWIAAAAVDSYFRYRSRSLYQFRLRRVPYTNVFPISIMSCYRYC